MIILQQASQKEGGVAERLKGSRGLRLASHQLVR